MDDMEQLKEAALIFRREMEQEKERLTERAQRLGECLWMLDTFERLTAENGRLKEENEGLLQQLTDEKQQRAELETKMNEMSKLSAGMARKAAQDDFHKALRTYLNISRRKTIGKREAAKNVITDLMTSAKLELPDDIMELLEHLDDEQTEPKTVTVNGNYVEAHNNGSVELKARV